MAWHVPTNIGTKITIICKSLMMKNESGFFSFQFSLFTMDFGRVLCTFMTEAGIRGGNEKRN